MLTIPKIDDGLTETAKSALLALSILFDRVGALPKADRDDLFELLREWSKTDDPEERGSIRRALEEILAQVPVSVKPLLSPAEKPLPRGLKSWAEHVGRRIRELREQAGMTQVQLAEKAALPQSHISRLENAEHSATNLTLERIAKALGVTVGELDPCSN